MVVWLFASAGHSEIRALPEFLNKNFPQLTFVRKFPISRKPAPKLRSDRVPNLAYQGASGYGLAKCITQVLKDTFYKGDEICDLILVIDDLDCCDQVQRTQLFTESVERAVTELQTSHKFTVEQIAKITDIPRHIAFAVPEIESWIIADWSNTIANNSSKFRKKEVVMKRYLQAKRVPCDSPESFGELDPIKQTCTKKLSEILIKSSRLNSKQTSIYSLESYSKASDTPEMLQNLDIRTVSAKCPCFRNLCNYLNVFSRDR